LKHKPPLRARTALDGIALFWRVLLRPRGGLAAVAAEVNSEAEGPGIHLPEVESWTIECDRL
jgi:hypothetical protein